MVIHFATDHAGLALKEIILAFVRDELGYESVDHGATVFSENDDYPAYMKSAAEAVVHNSNDRAIIFGGSGQGEAMVANRRKGVRAAVYYGGDLTIVRLSREHNNANILSLGARFLSEDEAKEAVRLWLATGFSGDERHVRRIAQIDEA